jgi:plasmid maintenance system antidote protein VapI
MMRTISLVCSDRWLNVQRRSDLWDATHSPREREQIDAHDQSGQAA